MASYPEEDENSIRYRQMLNIPSPQEVAIDTSLPLWKITLDVSFKVEMTLHSPSYDSAICNAIMLCHMNDVWPGPGIQVGTAGAICCTAKRVEPPPVCDGQGQVGCK